MLRKKIEAIAKKYGGCIYDYNEDGLLLLKKAGSQMIHLPVSVSGDISEDSYSSAIDFFSKTIETTVVDDLPLPKPCCFVNVEARRLNDVQFLDLLFYNIESFLSSNLVYLRIHFDIAPLCWKGLFQSFIARYKKICSDNLPILHLCGPFKTVSDADKYFLFSNHFRLWYVHDFISTDTPFFTENDSTVKELAEYGFRIPFLWYVHNKNIGMILHSVEEAMEINYNSGFALPTIQDAFYNSDKTIPPFQDYLQLLITAYKEYPFYDEVFMPLNILLQQSLINPQQVSAGIFRIDDLSKNWKRIEINEYKKRIDNFWHKAFLWQRWITVQKHLETAKK